MNKHVQNTQKWIAVNWKVLMIILVVFGVVVAWFFSKNSAELFETYAVKKTEVTQIVEARGVVRLGREVDLGFEASGRVTDVLVNNGDRVSEGQVLVKLNDAPVKAQLLKAKASLQAVLADGDANTVDIESAKRQLDRIKKEEATRVKNAYNTLLNTGLEVHAIEQYNNATAPMLSGTYGGPEGIYRLHVYRSNSSSGYSFNIEGIEEGVSTVTTESPAQLGLLGLYVEFDEDGLYDNTHWEIPIPNVRGSSYQTVVSAYTNAIQAKDTRIAGVEDDLARLQALDTGSLGGKASALINSARAEVKAVEAEVAKHSIRSPFDGVISGVSAEKGQSVRFGDTFSTLADPGAFEVSVNIPEVDVSKVQVETKAEISVDAFAGSRVWVGDVDFIDIVESYVDGVPVYKATIGVLDATTSLRAGMNATVKIVTQKYSDVFAVPSSYIFKNNKEQSVVHLQSYENAEGFVDYPIKAGFRGDAEMVVIESGLVGGEVIVRGSKGNNK